MALFRYVARLRIAAGHVEGETYEIDVELQEAIRGRRVRKRPIRASDGTTETLYRGGDTLWSLTLAPASGYQLELLEEFLASVATGESFTGHLFGPDVEPLSFRRDDQSGRRATFMRTGDARSDYYVHTLTLREL